MFEDAGHLAGCYLHNFRPPYPGFASKVSGKTLVYAIVDRIIDKTNYYADLRFDSGRHAAAVLDEYWEAVANFIERLLEVFHPTH